MFFFTFSSALKSRLLCHYKIDARNVRDSVSDICVNAFNYMHKANGSY